MVQRLCPRPAFPRAPDQPTLRDFALDAKGQIAIPGYINTFLRDYQREGVQFFYDQYKAGLGALLGDDMGLVSTATRCPSNGSSNLT